MNAQTRIDAALLRKRLSPLLALWERQARRIDGLSLRERAFLFLRPDGIYRAERWNSAQYILLVRTGDGRLAMPGAMPMDPADMR